MALGFMCGAEDLLLRGGRLVWGLAERALREWYESGLGPCQRFVQRCHRLRDRYQMTEGRLCQVHLLDDRKLELTVQPKLLSRELLDLVSSHFNLKEKEYFGITYTGDTGQCKWLQLDRRVLDHDFSKRTGPISLKFLVRFYIENFTFLKENITVELFFLNAKASVYNGDIEVESEDVFKLAAYSLQEAKGDYTSDENTRSDLKKLPTLPTKVLKEHPSLAYCEDRAIEHYKALKGLTRGQAVIQYLTLVESLPTYGVHYYEVKDKQGIPWWLGISYKGIGQYDLQDRLKPRKLFQWKQLENLYFREKKFAVEVHDPHRRTVTRRTFGQAGLVIHTWYASHSLIKSIWVMAISQHQFYLDRKQSKVKISTARSLGDIAMDLTESGVPRGSKLGINEGKDRLIMASNGSLVSAGSMDSEVNEEQKKEKISELRRKERELQGILDKKMEELKKICLREAELTGKLPKEYPLSSGEKTPQVRKRIGTTFKLDDVLNDQDPYLKNLEGRFALQQKIVEAAKKLATETEPCKTVKRKRKKNLLDAMRTLQEIENEINEHRIKMGKKPTQRVSLLIADETLTAELTSLDSLTLEGGEPAGTRRQRSRSVQYSPQLSNGPNSEYQQDRRASANEQHHDVGLDRLTYADVLEPYYSHRDALSTHSSPCKPSSRQPRDSCSMPPTPVMPRNAFSSIQLRSDDGPQPFRHRSGSLESQSQHTSDVDPYQPGFTLAPSRRSNSTEILDDGSSYTSQSSLEYSAPSGGAGSRTRDRWRHRKGNVYASAGSMPNLAQSDSRCYGYMTQACHAPTTYYVTGFPRYVEPEPYTNGGYVYEAETEGHYNVNPSYPAAIYHGHDRYGRYGDDEADGPPQNLYATLRPPRSRPAAPPQALRPELMARNIQRALVEEHLRGWYNRSLGSKQAAHTYERGSQQSLSPQAVPTPFGHASRTASNSSVSSAVSSRTWRGHQAMGLPDYEVGVAQQQQAYPGSYSSVHGRFSSCRSPECQRRGPFVPDSPSSSASSSSSSSMLSSLPPSSPSSTGHRLDRRNKHAYAKFSPRYEKEHFNPMSGNGSNGIHTDCPLGQDVNFSFAADDVGSYVDMNQIEPPVGSHLNSTLDSDAQMLYWHEDSKPGTIV